MLLMNVNTDISKIECFNRNNAVEKKKISGLKGKYFKFEKKRYFLSFKCSDRNKIAKL